MVGPVTIAFVKPLLPYWRTTMKFRSTLALTVTALALLTASGCAVQRGQESVGAYVDDSSITAMVKSRFVENKQVDAASISVETLKGTVMLSGFAKNTTERSTAEIIAQGVKGVTHVKNEITVRP
jgi:osmotically-inducible protein OsmY